VCMHACVKGVCGLPRRKLQHLTCGR